MRFVFHVQYTSSTISSKPLYRNSLWIIWKKAVWHWFKPFVCWVTFRKNGTSRIQVRCIWVSARTYITSIGLRSWLVKGIALRLAIGLGLHRELPFWNISPFDREVRWAPKSCPFDMDWSIPRRRRTWWVVVSFDSGSTITFGRPIVSMTNF